MKRANGIDVKNLSDRKLWELLRTGQGPGQEPRPAVALDAVMGELRSRQQLLPERHFHAPR